MLCRILVCFLILLVVSS